MKLPLLILLGGILGGCASSNQLPPDTTTAVLIPPVSWSAVTAENAVRPGSITDEWLKDFNSPQLEQLVAEAIAHNHDLKIAALNWYSANETASIASSNLLPTIEGGTSSKRSRSISSTDRASISNRHTLDVSAVWEVDLWNRLSNQERSAITLTEAVAADLRAARLSLAAEVAQNWFDSVESKQQTELAEYQLNADQQALKVVEDRFQNGLVDALDLHLIKIELTASEERLASKRMGQNLLLRELETLLGRYPAAELTVSEPMPEIGGSIPAGLPSDLLKRRPDIAASNKRMVAAGLDAEVAAKNRLPSFSLTASGGTSSSELKNLLDWDFLIWSLLGDLTQPLFQQERLKAEEMLERIEHREALINHAQIIRTAFREVEDALDADHYQRLRVESLTRAANESHSAAVLALYRYQNGLTDILTLLDAKQRAYTHESKRLRAVADHINNRITLHLALGGSF